MLVCSAHIRGYLSEMRHEEVKAEAGIGASLNEKKREKEKTIISKIVCFVCTKGKFKSIVTYSMNSQILR